MANEDSLINPKGTVEIATAEEQRLRALLEEKEQVITGWMQKLSNATASIAKLTRERDEQRVVELLLQANLSTEKERFAEAAAWNKRTELEMTNLRSLKDDLEADLVEAQKFQRRLEWLHDCSGGSLDAEGYEWGVFRVKWNNGHPESVRQTLSDMSDLDAEIERAK